MKRTRFSRRSRPSADTATLERLATGLSESGSKLEDAFWEAQLAELIDGLLASGAEDDLNAALDRLFEATPRAHDELADMVEARAETCTLDLDGRTHDVLLFALPLLAWSRYAIASGPIPAATARDLMVQAGAHLCAAGSRIALTDYLFSPDQLPRTFVDTAGLVRALGEAALAGQTLHLDTAGLPETNRFLSDVRYLVGAVVAPQGDALFRWQERDGGREEALHEWMRQGMPLLEPLLTGSACQSLLPDAYHSACREADRASRPYSVKASVAFLQTALGIAPERLRAIVGPFHDRRLEEYRIGLGPIDRDVIHHGVVWPLLGTEDENTDSISEIEAVLREAGIVDIVHHDHAFPFEFCDDCGAPFFPNAEGEAVHAEMPDEEHGTATPSQTLH